MNMVISIQLLRAIAALMVVLHHIAIKAEQYHTGALSSYHIGYFGVDLFFIISGYIMCHSIASRPMNFGQFMQNRIKRIIPLYWAVTAIAMIIYLLAPSMVNASGGETSLFSSWTLIPSGNKLLVNNGWTLSYEFLFYIIFAGWLISTSLNRQILFSSLTLIMLVVAGIIFHPHHPTLKFITNEMVIEFILGMLAFKIIQKNIMPMKYCLLLLLLGVAILAGQNQLGIMESFTGRTVSAGVPMFLLFVAVVGMEPLINKTAFPGKKAAILVGNASYSIYLTHPFVLSPAALVLKKLHLTHYNVLFVLLMFVGAVITGVLSWRLIEQPINTYFKRGKIAPATLKQSIS
jgi:peptidoglycan/LPS O-acetylase OafA/YrhL